MWRDGGKVSLTEALRGGAPEAFGVLYDEHAERLYAYCHIMVGDEAADAVRDAFIAVARHPGTAPHDDAALPVWLHALARAECVRRGALVRKIVGTPSADPLRRALARLRPEHREVLALSASLEPAGIARVVGVARDTAEMLVQVARRRLEQAVVSVLGPLADEPVLAALTTGDLHKLVMRGYEPPPRQRERVLFSCAAAERAADGALLFDQDGMPIPLDALFSGADDRTHPFRQVRFEEPFTAPMRQVDAPVAESRPRTVRVSHARPKKQPFLARRRDGLFEVAGLAACVAAATGVLALWPSPHPNGASNVDGTSLFLHRPGTASRSVQPAPAGNDTPPQAATSKPGASPSPTKAESAPTTAPPDTTAAAAQPTAGPSHPTPPASPTPPPTSTPDPPTSTPDPPTSTPDPPTTTPTPPDGPTPSETPTDHRTDSPTPDPSAS
jgi:DNA-directed RNA polymerase specialized sigma24 family protein